MKSLPYAASQSRTTRSRSCASPRSTRSHWSSLGWLAQRVARSPSTANRGPRPPDSELDAAVSAPWESRVSGAAAALVVTTTEVDATRTPVIVAAIRRRPVPARRLPCRGGVSVVVRVVPCMLPPSRSSRAAEPLGQERATLRG
ncbi:hypothetical protein A0J59_08815 [Cellulosimicrobium sp. I38E]|nr:hypothetical protein A0J59_08815 [Cellulosimicrobium sp. I38E]